MERAFRIRLAAVTLLAMAGLGLTALGPLLAAPGVQLPADASAVVSITTNALAWLRWLALPILAWQVVRAVEDPT